MNFEIQPLPQTSRAAIKRQLPDIPIAFVESAFVRCQLLRAQKPQPSADVRKSLESVTTKAAALEASLGSLSDEARKQLWAALEPVGGVEFFEQANFVTQALMGLSRNAASDVDVNLGRPETWKHGLIRSLANLLEAHGRTADDTREGDLCFLSAELIKTLDERAKDIRSTVRDAVAKSAPE